MNTRHAILVFLFLYNEPRPTKGWDGVRSVGSVGDSVTRHRVPVGILVHVHHIVRSASGGEILSNHIISDRGNIVVVHLVKRGNDVEHDDVIPSAATSDGVHNFFSLLSMSVPPSLGDDPSIGGPCTPSSTHMVVT
nr:MAG TPA: hypothetical protein [Caudoviricetes sp.]